VANSVPFEAATEPAQREVPGCALPAAGGVNVDDVKVADNEDIIDIICVFLSGFAGKRCISIESFFGAGFPLAFLL